MDQGICKRSQINRGYEERRWIRTRMTRSSFVSPLFPESCFLSLSLSLSLIHTYAHIHRAEGASQVHLGHCSLFLPLCGFNFPNAWDLINEGNGLRAFLRIPVSTPEYCSIFSSSATQWTHKWLMLQHYTRFSADMYRIMLNVEKHKICTFAHV